MMYKFEEDEVADDPDTMAELKEALALLEKSNQALLATRAELQALKAAMTTSEEEAEELRAFKQKAQPTIALGREKEKKLISYIKQLRALLK